jgi:programmed cell death 6-interacting protein
MLPVSRKTKQTGDCSLITLFVRPLIKNCHSTLQSMNLPSALEALEKPIGLPPSLLKKAEEVRLERGPDKIKASIEDIQKLAQQDVAILNEVYGLRTINFSLPHFPVRPWIVWIVRLRMMRLLAGRNRSIDYPPTRQIENLSRRSVVFEISYSRRPKAMKQYDRNGMSGKRTSSNSHGTKSVFSAFFISHQCLLVMQVDLEASVPSARSNMSSSQTRMHARNLRILLEALDDICKVRSEIVKRAERLAKTDDVQPRIMRAASGFERWVEVQPAMFEDVCDEEIAKYDKFLQELRECEKKQDEILESIEVCLLSCCIYVSVFNGGRRPATSHFCSPERTTHL